MKDYNDLYARRYDFHFKKLEQKFQSEIKEKRGNKNNLRNEFIREVASIRDIQIKGVVLNNPDNSPITNQFKESLISYFRCIETDYPEDKINGFVEFEIPDQKRQYLKFQENDKRQDKYIYDLDFVYEATNDDILEMLAIYLSHDDFLKKLANIETADNTDFYEKKDISFIEIRKPKVPQRKANDNYTSLSLVQTAIFFRLLKEDQIILNDPTYQPDTELSKAIQAMTGFSPNTLRQELGKPLHHIDKELEDIKEVVSSLQRLISKAEKQLSKRL